MKRTEGLLSGRACAPGDRHAGTRVDRLWPLALAALLLLVLCGCHDWPEEDVTALETQTILSDISRMDAAEADVEWPTRYRLSPSKIRQVVGGKHLRSRQPPEGGGGDDNECQEPEQQTPGNAQGIEASR